MNYPSDLTDPQWEAIRQHLEFENGYGNRRKHPIRLMVNAIFYLVKPGCPWRQLPKNFPNWKSVYSYYRRLCHPGTWEKILDDWNRRTRLKSGRSPSPSYAIVDSQSGKTVYGGEERGFDGGKKSQRSKTSYRG